MRTRGTGSITPHKGGFWARLRVEGAVKSFGVHPTYEDAERVLNRALIARASKPGASAGVLTFAAWGRRVLDMREEDGVRGIKSERRTFRRHLETCTFASKAVADVTSADIVDLSRTLSNKKAADRRERRKLERESVQRVLTLVRCIFTAAVARDMRTSNPCVGVVVKAKRDADDDESEVWDWLRGEEQVAVLTCERIPLWLRTMMRVAWGTGLRQGEMWNLELKDVHIEIPISSSTSRYSCSCGASPCLALRERGAHLHVRYGSPGHLPPKNGKVRRTPLFGEGLAGMTAWLEMLPSYAPANPLRLAFPATRGCRRQPGAPERSSPRDASGKQRHIDMLHEAITAAGVSRTIRWHDLRHTCASSLVSGTWGRKWDLMAVRDMLGHKDIKTTQRYAHPAEGMLHEAGRETPGLRVTSRVTGNGPGGGQPAAITNESCEGGDLNPYASYGAGGMLELRVDRPKNTTSVTRDAGEVLLRALAAGDPQTLALAAALSASMATSAKRIS